MGDLVSPENVGIPEPPQKLRPGGALIDRPRQSFDGKWYNNFGETEISEEQARREEAELQKVRGKIRETSIGKDVGKLSEGVPGVDAQRLKGIYERCVAEYEGKNPNGLLDINVILDEADKAEVKKLIDIAKNTHTELADGNPNWIQFVKLRDEMRAILGTFGEDTRIIEDNLIQTPTKGQVKNNVPIIRVPTNIYRLSVWDSRIGSLDSLFTHYDRGNAKGQMASFLGNSIQEVYGLVKQIYASHGQKQYAFNSLF